MGGVSALPGMNGCKSETDKGGRPSALSHGCLTYISACKDKRRRFMNEKRGVVYVCKKRGGLGREKKKNLDVIQNCKIFFHVDDVRSALQNYLLKRKRASFD